MYIYPCTYPFTVVFNFFKLTNSSHCASSSVRSAIQWTGEASARATAPTIPLDDVDQFPLSVIPLLVPPLLSLEESLGRKKVRLIDLRTTNFLLTQYLEEMELGLWN